MGEIKPKVIETEDEYEQFLVVAERLTFKQDQSGKLLILDGNQRTLRSLELLNNVFEEPYIQAYATGNLDAWMGKAGFDRVQTKDVFCLNQVTRGVRL